MVTKTWDTLTSKLALAAFPYNCSIYRSLNGVKNICNNFWWYILHIGTNEFAIFPMLSFGSLQPDLFSWYNLMYICSLSVVEFLISFKNHNQQMPIYDLETYFFSIHSYSTKKRKHSFHILKALFSSDSLLSVCEKNFSTFSCNSEVLQYQQIIHSFI